MVQFLEERLWAKLPEHPGVLVVCSNAVIRPNGALALSDGYAIDAREQIPGIDKEGGAIASQLSDKNYGFLQIRHPRVQDQPNGESFGKRGIGVFQIAYTHKSGISVDVVKASVMKLASYVRETPYYNIRMDSPVLYAEDQETRDAIADAMSILPDNVTLTTVPRTLDDAPLEVGDKVASAVKSRSSYHWIGEVHSFVPNYPHLVYVDFPDRLDPKETDGMKLREGASVITYRVDELRKLL